MAARYGVSAPDGDPRDAERECAELGSYESVELWQVEFAEYLSSIEDTINERGTAND